MSLKPICLLFCLLPTFTALAQSPCQSILSQAQAALNRGNTEQALRKLQDVEICDDNNQLTRQRQRLQTAIFKLINEQKQEAIDARAAVDEALLQVQQEKEATQLALNKAQKLVEAFYFYKDRFALAYGEAKIGGSRYENHYYFIDENGEWVEKLSSWVRAEQFGEDGFARVIGENFWGREVACWLDTTGSVYQVAYQYDELESETKIADFSEADLDMAQLIDKMPLLSQLERLILDGNVLDPDTLISLLHELAQLENFTHLSLENCALDSLPAEIAQLTKLHSLNIIANKLSLLPAELIELEHLNVLNIDHNHFSQFPETLTQMKGLEVLTYYGNSFPPLSSEIFEMSNLVELAVLIDTAKNLPAAIGQLNKLRKLEIYSDSLTALPPELFLLTELEVLFIRGGNIKTIPPEIDRLIALENLSIQGSQVNTIPRSIGSLRQLKILRLDGNQLKEIPSEIGQLEHLKLLSLSDNQLLNLPNEIGELKQLSEIWLYNNHLTSLPVSIGELNNLDAIQLNNNRLDVLAVDWSKLNRLRRLYLEENPLTELPKGIEQLPLLQNLSLMGSRIGMEEINTLRAMLPSCNISPQEYDLVGHYELSGNYAAIFEFYKLNTIERDANVGSEWHYLSHYALFVGEYETAIMAAQRTLELEPASGGRVEAKMALGYLLNDQWPQAEAVYLKWEGQSFANNYRLYKEIFLEDIADLETAGITHPDFAKVRALLEED